jgi:hypothetical protein
MDADRRFWLTHAIWPLLLFALIAGGGCYYPFRRKHRTRLGFRSRHRALYRHRNRDLVGKRADPRCWRQSNARPGRAAPAGVGMHLWSHGPATLAATSRLSAPEHRGGYRHRCSAQGDEQHQLPPIAGGVRWPTPLHTPVLQSGPPACPAHAVSPAGIHRPALRCSGSISCLWRATGAWHPRLWHSPSPSAACLLSDRKRAGRISCRMTFGAQPSCGLPASAFLPSAIEVTSGRPKMTPVQSIPCPTPPPARPRQGHGPLAGDNWQKDRATVHAQSF